MKVLYIVHSFPPFNWRGTEIYAMELARSMTEHHDCFLFHLVDDPAAVEVSREEDVFQGIKVFRARLKLRPEKPETYFFHPRLETAFSEILSRAAPHVVHFIYFAGGLPLSLPLKAADTGACLYITVTDFSGICPRGQLIDRDGGLCKGPRQGLRCAWCLFGRTFLEGHSRTDRLLREYCPPALTSRLGGPPLHLLRKRLGTIQKAFARARLVIFPNRNCLRRYKEAGFTGNFTVMDYGIDTAPFAGHRKQESPVPRIGFVGQLLPHKGLHVLADALDGLAGDWKLLVYGSREDPLAERYYSSLALPESRTEFRGTFDFSEMDRVLEEMDVLVVPSTWEENCPLIVKYGLATGTPVVASDQPGIVGGPADNPGLLRFRSGDAADLRKTLEQALVLRKDIDSPANPEQQVTDVREQARYLADEYEKCVKAVGAGALAEDADSG